MPQDFKRYQVIHKLQEKENKAIISGNWKFIVIEENKNFFKKEIIATKALNKADYKSADTKNFLLVFCVKDIHQEEFKSLIDSKLKANPFDKKNPQIFIDSILSNESKIEAIKPVVDFYFILEHLLPEIKDIKQEKEEEKAITFIKKKIRKAQKELCNFDIKDEISEILVSVSTRLENDQKVSLKELNSYIRQINHVKYKIWLIKLENEQLELEKLQSVFKGMDEEKAIIPLKGSAIALLAKYTTDPEVKNLAKLANCTIEVIERCEFYKNKLQQSISNFEKDMAEMTKELDQLHTSLSAETLEKCVEEVNLVEKIKIFLDNLRPEKTLAVLQKEASQIKEIYTKRYSGLEKIITSEQEVDNFKLKRDRREINKFFKTNGLIFDQIEQHGEKIEHGRWGADKKAEILKNIHTQIIQISEASTELNRAPTEHKASNILDDFKSLSQTINDSKETLSRYRGISLFRSIATLWGGGKIKSMDFITKLEVGLKELKDNTDTHLKVTRKSI